MTRSLVLALLAGALLLAGCGDTVGPSHPDPLPDLTLTRASALLKTPLEPATGPVKVVGLPGCVAGKGTVTIETLGKTTSTGSTDQGTFTMTVTSTVGARLAIRYQASDPAFRTVVAHGVMTGQSPGPIAGVSPLTDLGGGRYRVRGRTPAGAGAPIFGINDRTVEIALATAGAGGDFQLELAAASGDTLQLHDDKDPLGNAWSLVVP